MGFGGDSFPLKVDPAVADGTAVNLENEDLHSWDLAAITPEDLAARGVPRPPGDPTGFGAAFAAPAPAPLAPPAAPAPPAVAESEAP